MTHDVEHEEVGKCGECEKAATAVASWNPPVLAKTFVGHLLKVSYALSVSALFLLTAHEGHMSGGAWGNFVMGLFFLASVVGFSGVAVAIIVDVIRLLVFNVFRKDRGIYQFLDKDRRLHRHLTLNVGTPFAATPVSIGIGVGWWFRRTVCYGAAWQNWEVVGSPRLEELVVKDRRGCQLPGDLATTTALETIAQYESVWAVLRKADVEARMYKWVADRLGVGVQATILSAIAGKSQTLSSAAKVLRERLEQLLKSLVNKDYYGLYDFGQRDKMLEPWKVEAARLLEEERRAVEVDARIAAQAREVPATTAAGATTGGAR